jgi:hypothetical protein
MERDALVVESDNFAMFTESGNSLVRDLVAMAQRYGLQDNVVLGMMNAIAKDHNFSEITDTAVREEIGCHLGWYE